MKGWMRRLLLSWLVVSLALSAAPGTSFAVSNGTADGTYDFGGAVGPDIDGYKKVGDKFLVQTGFAQSGTSLIAASHSDPEVNGYLDIVAEGTTLNRAFTFKDLGFSVTDNSGIVMDFIYVTLFDENGAQIATLNNFMDGNATTKTMGTGTIQLSSWLNKGGITPYNYAGVSKIRILWTFDNKVVPSKLRIDNITIANVTGGYPVAYNGNGNTSGNAPSTGYVTIGKTGTAKGADTLAKTGHTFGGWNRNAAGTGVNYDAGAPLTGVTSGTTLYAKWVPVPTYKVVYNGNGNTSGSAPTDAASYAPGTSATVQGSGTLARTGYSFAGWNTAANGSGPTNYAAGASLTMPAANVTLYAKWSLIPTYKVTYDGNGSDSGTVPVDGGSYAAGASATVQGSGTLARTGYSFDGWNTAADGSGPTNYAAGASLAMPASNVTLYAKWSLIPKYTVAYDGNGSDSGTVPVDGGSYVAGASATVQGVGTLAKTGHTFAGWNTAADGSGPTDYAAGASLAMPASNVTLYAKWSLIPTYTVAYDGNGSDSGTVPVDGGSYLSGASATVQGSDTLARAGYSFAGWNTAADGSGPTDYAAGASLAMPASNVTLYAKWILIPTYTVTYDGNGNTGGTVPADGGSYVTGASATVLGPATLAKPGYSFKGWNAKADGTGTGYAAGAALTMPAENVTLYAQWAWIDVPVFVHTAKVIAGDDPTLSRTIFIGRNIDSDGTERETATLDATTASQIVDLAKANGKSTVRVVFDGFMSQSTDETTVIVPQASVQLLKQGFGLEIATRSATLTLSEASIKGLPDADARFKLIRHADEPEAKIANRITLESGDADVPIELLIPLKTTGLPSDPSALKTLLASLRSSAAGADGTIERIAGQIVTDSEGRPVGYKANGRTGPAVTYTIVSWQAPFVAALMRGYPDGTFRPDRKLTRAEIAALLYPLLEADGTKKAPVVSFPDVSSTHWAAKAISSVGGAGFMTGDADGKFRPDDYVSRAEAASIIAKWSGLTLDGARAPFKDTAGHPAEASIAAVARQGYMIGRGDGKFVPDSPITRAEAAALFNRATGRKPPTEREPIWSDVPRRHWALPNIAGATGVGIDPPPGD
ncbi:InlB B-repeat-containing protein [Cohnella sp. GCM10027633]|uniref:InlB B-repeat-containing protein n=1 Tax=unclassified Cohnella TaxID=2636738 RepID=UPI0036456697